MSDQPDTREPGQKLYEELRPSSGALWDELAPQAQGVWNQLAERLASVEAERDHEYEMRVDADRVRDLAYDERDKAQRQLDRLKGLLRGARAGASSMWAHPRPS
jgi:hypothetical protein